MFMHSYCYVCSVLYILFSSCQLALFSYPDRFCRAFSSVVRQMPGYNSQREGTARTLPKLIVLFYVLFVLCRSVYCLCVNVYCSIAAGWQPNCSLTNLSYHIIPYHIVYHIKSYHIISYTIPHHIISYHTLFGLACCWPSRAEVIVHSFLALLELLHPPRNLHIR